MLFQDTHNLTAKKTERRKRKRNAALKGNLVDILKVNMNVSTSSVSEQVSLNT